MPTQMKGIAGDERVDIQVGDRRLECRVVADRWWFDTEDITVADIEQEFFVTLAGKAKWQANFEGDRSLVKEREYALIFGMHASMVLTDLAGSPIPPDMIEMFFGGSYEWKVNDVVVAEGNNLELVGGPGWQIHRAPLAAGSDIEFAQMGDKTQNNIRKFWKPILVTGGRSVDFLLRVPNAATEAHYVKVKLYGLHLVPTGKKLTRKQIRARGVPVAVA